MNTTKIISIASFKGGTGKTLTTFNIAGLLAREYNKKILVVDMDPQHNMSNLLLPGDIEGTERIFKYDSHPTPLNATEVIHSSHLENIDIIPASLRLIKTETDITSIIGRESILKRWVKNNVEYLSQYDYIFFDTNPTMSTININAFLISSSILLVTDIDVDSLIAIETFLEAYYPIQYRIDSDGENNIKGIIVNKLKEGTIMDKDFVSYVQDEKYPYKNLLFDTYIHEAVALRETKAKREPIYAERNKRAYNEFKWVIEELFERGVL